MFHCNGLNLALALDGQVAGISPLFLLELIQRLPEGSEYMAERIGGREHRDWGLQAYLLAGVINAINTNTKVVGNWKGKPPEFPVVNGPEAKKPENKNVVRGEEDEDLEDFYTRMAKVFG